MTVLEPFHALMLFSIHTMQTLICLNASITRHIHLSAQMRRLNVAFTFLPTGLE